MAPAEEMMMAMAEENEPMMEEKPASEKPASEK